MYGGAGEKWLAASVTGTVVAGRRWSQSTYYFRGKVDQMTTIHTAGRGKRKGKRRGRRRRTRGKVGESGGGFRGREDEREGR